MNYALGIVYGMVAMFGWGIADFFVAKALLKTTIMKTYFYSQLVGAIILFLIVGLFFKYPSLSVKSAVLAVFCGLLAATAYLCFYKSIEIGKISVVSPVFASWGIVVVGLGYFFLGEQLASLEYAAVLFILIGIVLVSMHFEEFKTKSVGIAKGIGYAVVALFSYGLSQFLLVLLIKEMGWFIPLMLMKVCIVVVLLLFFRFKKTDITFPRYAWVFVLAIGLLELIAYIGYGIGVTQTYASIVSPIAAAFPAVTVVLALIFFKEKIAVNQYIGIGSILAGLILLSI